MIGYLSADIICSEKRTVFLELRSRKTVSYEEQIMSKDKYPSIFSPRMATIVFIILQIFFATREVLKIGEYSRIFPSFSCGIFGHVTRLGQSRVSKKIWWIITGDIRSFVRGKKKWSEKMSTERFKNVTSFVINLLNNKTIILLNLAEYRLILA